MTEQRGARNTWSIPESTDYAQASQPSSSPSSSSGHSSWKFWRRLSTRRRGADPKKIRHGRLSVRESGPHTLGHSTRHSDLDLRHCSSTREGIDGGGAGAGGGGGGGRISLDHPPGATSGSLPDVVNLKTVLTRSASLRAPPKPPRLFLCRSASQPGSRTVETSATNAKVSPLSQSQSSGGGEAVPGPREPYRTTPNSAALHQTQHEEEPIYVNSAFGANLKASGLLTGNDRIIPPSLHTTTTSTCTRRHPKKNSVHAIRNDTTVTSGTEKGELLYEEGEETARRGLLSEQWSKDMKESGRWVMPSKNQTLAAASTTVSASTYDIDTLPPPRRPRPPSSSSLSLYYSLPHTHRTKSKRHPTLSSTSTTNSSSSSSVKRSGGAAADARMMTQSVLQTVHDLLCQRLDPRLMLDSLYSVDLLTALDVQAFRGHPDRRLICEHVIRAVVGGSGDEVKKEKEEDEGEDRLTAFLEVLRLSCGDGCEPGREEGGNGGNGELVEILETVRDVHGVIHHIPATPPPPTEEEEEEIGEEVGRVLLAEEKVLTLEVGYLMEGGGGDGEAGGGGGGVILRPVVELDRVRPPGSNDRKLSPHPKNPTPSPTSNPTSTTNLLFPPLSLLSSSAHQLNNWKDTKKDGSPSPQPRRSPSPSLSSTFISKVWEVGPSSPSDEGFSSASSSTHPLTLAVTACVTGHSLSGPRAVALAQVLRQHPCLVELRIGKTELDSADVAVLCGALRQQALQHEGGLLALDLRLNVLGPVGACAVASVLSCGSSRLRQLNVSSTSMDVAGVRQVLTAVAGNRTLRELDLSFLNVGDATCDALRDTLRTNTGLKRLRLRSNNISPAGVAVLAEGLHRNRTLQELDLSRNMVGEEGAEALARHVPESCLAELSLENCGVTAEACRGSVSEMIVSGKRLRSLDLSVNPLGDEGVQGLWAALERSSVLRVLSLNMCGVTNRGFSLLLDALATNASLGLLKLCYNRLGKAAPPAPHAALHAASSPASSQDPDYSWDSLRYRLRIVTSSRPKLRILLWGNAFCDTEGAGAPGSRGSRRLSSLN